MSVPTTYLLKLVVINFFIHNKLHKQCVLTSYERTYKVLIAHKVNLNFKQRANLAKQLRATQRAEFQVNDFERITIFQTVPNAVV